MNKNYWINKWNLPDNIEILFYQNPKYFRNNSFRKEMLDKEFDKLLKIKGIIKLYTITGIANGKHKNNNGRRLKVCLVKEYIEK